MSTVLAPLADYSVGPYGTLVNYPSQVLTETSPAQVIVEPVTLAQAKAHSVVPERSPVDAAEDALLRLMISAARSVAETESGLELAQRQWDVFFDFLPPAFAIGYPLVSVDLFTLRDSTGAYRTLVADQDYIVDTAKQPGLIIPPYNGDWPSYEAWPTSSVMIRVTSGYSASSSWWSGDAGSKIQLGILFLVSEWFNNRLPYDAPVKEYPYTLRMLLSGGFAPKAR